MLREKAGLTQRELAAKLGKPQSVIAKIELGTQPVLAIDVISWAEATDAEPLDAFKRMMG